MLRLTSALGALGEMKLFFDKGPDLLVITAVIFPPLPQEGGCLPIAITTIFQVAGLDLFGYSQSGRALISLGHETLLPGRTVSGGLAEAAIISMQRFNTQV
jgi:hypothetical protein